MNGTASNVIEPETPRKKERRELDCLIRAFFALTRGSFFFLVDTPTFYDGDGDGD